ncbi:MAG: peptide methionine sulfoxide reductase, partial [Proteobacteria bacterium]
DSQLKLAKSLRDEYQKQLTAAGFGQIQTTIKPLDKFYPAEDYHQDYIAKNPNGYCPDHSTGVTFSDSPSVPKTVAEVDNSALLTGQSIVVLEADGYCPYCEKFRKDVSEAYQGDIPLVYRTAKQLQDLDIETPTWATPTIYFLEDGQETFAKQGYMAAKEFYKALGAFKLGDSEAYKVAFAEGTDNRFCKQYDLFKDTPPGVFVDKLSGEPLFDTEHRFNSGTGWLSFTQPVEGAVVEQADHSLGMVRTEVIAKTSGIHLGHVFDDGPNGHPRYCINATVLDFVAR